MTRVNSIDYAVIGWYALLMVLVGVYVMRFNRGAAEYFRAGSRVREARSSAAAAGCPAGQPHQELGLPSLLGF